MHNKFCIIDGKSVINGSYNWTYYAENRNKENILIITNEDLMQSFYAEFEKLKEEEQIRHQEKVRPLSYYELSDNETYEVATYLAMDMLYAAGETRNESLANEALKWSGDNHELEKTATALKFTYNYKLTETIGRRLTEDRYFVMFQKGKSLPAKFTKTFRNSIDNQKSICAEILYGDGELASENTKLRRTKLNGLPIKPAGEVVTKVRAILYANGTLDFEEFSLYSGKSTSVKIDVSNFIKRVPEDE